MNTELQNLRSQIDDANLELLRLLNLRTSIIKSIRELKDTNGIDYFSPTREMEMLETVIKNNNGPLYNELVTEIFTTIFSTALRYMGKEREKQLLISSNYNNGFLSIKDMFNFHDSQPVIIAGPCAVEKIEYLEAIALLLQKSGIKFLRAGAFKPRTSPYEFQGLKREGLKMLSEVGKKHNLLTVTEVVDTRDVSLVADYIDILQIGARNMHNFELLKEAGQSGKPILLKRGIAATIKEFMFAAEYIGLQGNRKIILCERGIRSYETKTRNTLDISAIPIIKKETSLPIIVDLSHSLGRKDIVNPIAKAALAAGADGIMVEAHPYPEVALSDSKQQLNPQEFLDMLEHINFVGNR